MHFTNPRWPGNVPMYCANGSWIQGIQQFKGFKVYDQYLFMINYLSYNPRYIISVHILSNLDTLSTIQGLLLPVIGRFNLETPIGESSRAHPHLHKTLSIAQHCFQLQSSKNHQKATFNPKTSTQPILIHPPFIHSIPTCKLLRSQIMMLQSWEPVKSTSPTVQRHCTKPLWPAKMWTQCLEEKLPSCDRMAGSEYPLVI